VYRQWNVHPAGHNVRHEHGIPVIPGPSGPVGKQVADSNVLDPGVPVIQIDGIVEDSVGTENVVVEAQFSLFHQMHDGRGGNEFGKAGKAEDMAGFHRLGIFFIRVTEPFGIDKAPVLGDRDGSALYPVTFQEIGNGLFHLLGSLECGHIVPDGPGYFVDLVGLHGVRSLAVRKDGTDVPEEQDQDQHNLCNYKFRLLHLKF
jgi:hypothetical protein